MIRTYLQNKDILEKEPVLADYLDADYVDYQTFIDTAYKELNKDVRHKGLDMRYVCVPITLESDTTMYSDDETDVSAEDKINRSILTLIVSSVVSGGAEFKLYGTNSSEDDATFTLIDSIVLDENDSGTFHLEFFDYFTYYKLKHVGGTAEAGSAVTLAVLTESIYYHLHLYKTLFLIYQSMERVEGDNWYAKASEYIGMYDRALASAILYVDTDGDGVIDDDEAKQTIRQYRIVL